MAAETCRAGPSHRDTGAASDLTSLTADRQDISYLHVHFVLIYSSLFLFSVLRIELCETILSFYNEPTAIVIHFIIFITAHKICDDTLSKFI